MRFILLVAFLYSSNAVASGCGGGAWELVSEKKLPKTEIVFGYYSSGTSSEVSVYWEVANVRILNVGTQKEKIPFFASVNLSQVDLVDLLRQISLQPNSVLAGTTETVQINREYDDCNDIPENTTQTTTIHTLDVKLTNGGRQKFTGVVTKYDPPLKY